MMPRRFWSAEDVHRLANLYPDRPTKEVATSLNRPISGVYRMASKIGIEKSQAFLDSEASGRISKGQTRPGSVATQFHKGSVPANKGLRRPGFAPGRMKETQFKKGQRSGCAADNWVPIGTILNDTDGYPRIKIREAEHGKEATGFGNTGVWPFLSRHIWEQYKGPIPPKHMVVFKDRDKQNCIIENLELISMADNARRNSMWRNLPRELAEVIQLSGALKRSIRSRDGKEQDKRSTGSSFRNVGGAEGPGQTDGSGARQDDQSGSADNHQLCHG